MEHPFINDLDSLTVEELSSKISELQKKMSIAHRTGNGHLCGQIQMALESYQTKYQQKLEKQFAPKGDGAGFDLDSKIDIS